MKDKIVVLYIFVVVNVVRLKRISLVEEKKDKSERNFKRRTTIVSRVLSTI